MSKFRKLLDIYVDIVINSLTGDTDVQVGEYVLRYKSTKFSPTPKHLFIVYADGVAIKRVYITGFDVTFQHSSNNSFHKQMSVHDAEVDRYSSLARRYPNSLSITDALSKHKNNREQYLNDSKI